MILYTHIMILTYVNVMYCSNFMSGTPANCFPHQGSAVALSCDHIILFTCTHGGS